MPCLPHPGCPAQPHPTGCNVQENERIGLIVTAFGVFAREDQATGFNESEIARNMSDIGPNTEEIITNHGVYVSSCGIHKKVRRHGAYEKVGITNACCDC